MILYTAAALGEFRTSITGWISGCYGLLRFDAVRIICTPGSTVTLELVVKSTPADA
jgi:hypothetical protein